MQTIIGEHKIKNWQKGASFELRVYAGETFFDADGAEIPFGRVGSFDAYLKLACAYDAATKTLTVPAVSIVKTDTSLDNPNARYSLAGIYSGNVLKHTILKDFAVPASLGDAVSWAQLAVYRQPGRRLFDTETYTKSQVNSLLVNLFGASQIYSEAWNGSNEVVTKDAIYRLKQADGLFTLIDGGDAPGGAASYLDGGGASTLF